MASATVVGRGFRIGLPISVNAKGVFLLKRGFVSDAVAPVPHTTCFMISSPILLKKAFSLLKLTSSDIFLDIGSGDGSILLEAAVYKPKKLISVEIDEDLCRK